MGSPPSIHLIVMLAGSPNGFHSCSNKRPAFAKIWNALFLRSDETYNVEMAIAFGVMRRMGRRIGTVINEQE